MKYEIKISFERLPKYLFIYLWQYAGEWKYQNESNALSLLKTYLFNFLNIPTIVLGRSKICISTYILEPKKILARIENIFLKALSLKKAVAYIMLPDDE